MGKVGYRIQSKIMGPDGKPDFVKYGTSENIEYTVKWHMFHLKHRTHPDPQLMRYTLSRGADVLEIIIDPLDTPTEPVIEKAVIVPQKETRAKKKNG
jgi:hypothetical protein